MNENEIAKRFLEATTNDISVYSRWCSLYGEQKFSDKELGKRVKALRSAFYHDGSDKARENFWSKHSNLKNFLLGKD